MEPQVGLPTEVTLSPNRGRRRASGKANSWPPNSPEAGARPADGPHRGRRRGRCFRGWRHSHFLLPSETPPFYGSSPNTDFHPPPGKELETPRERPLLLFERTQLKNNLVSLKSDAAGYAVSGEEGMDGGGEGGVEGSGVGSCGCTCLPFPFGPGGVFFTASFPALGGLPWARG